MAVLDFEDSSDSPRAMRVKTKKTEEEIRKQFFGSLAKASTSARPWTEVEPTWCELSETRLFTKILEYKPAGVNKRFNLMALTHYMNNIYEDEDIDFEDYLSPADLVALRARKDQSADCKVMVFRPKYKLRPTSDQIMEKLNSMYNMSTIDSNEYVPELFERPIDFFLPEGEFSELMEKKEKSVNAALAPPPGAPPKKKKRRNSNDSSSRPSTPAQKV